MKKITYLLVFLLSFITKLNGQINPVQNLTYTQTYQSPYNFFELNWEEPAQPHNLLIGYNIYRDNEFYRFQTETTLYNLYNPMYGFVSNCGIDFLEYNVPNGFLVHVKAVYEGQIESSFIETASVNPPALINEEFDRQNVLLYPNPTKNTINLLSKNNKIISEITIYNSIGQITNRKYGNSTAINVENLSNGLYFMEIKTENKIYKTKFVKE